MRGDYSLYDVAVSAVIDDDFREFTSITCLSAFSCDRLKHITDRHVRNVVIFDEKTRSNFLGLFHLSLIHI